MAKENKDHEFDPIEVKKEKKNVFSRAWGWIKENPWKMAGIVTVGVGIGVFANDKSRNAVIGGMKAGVGRVRGMVSKKPQQIEGATAEVAEAPVVAEGMTPADKPQYEGGRERRNFRGDFNNRFERNFNNNQN